MMETLCGCGGLVVKCKRNKLTKNPEKLCEFIQTKEPGGVLGCCKGKNEDVRVEQLTLGILCLFLGVVKRLNQTSAIWLCCLFVGGGCVGNVGC
jgi:hypothetical protein